MSAKARPGTRIKKIRIKPKCPACNIEMKRKGKKGKDEYFKCPQCKGKWKDGVFSPKQDPAILTELNYKLKEQRKEAALRKLIRRLKKQKYIPVKVFRWEGKVINLDEYDKDGISLAEKKKWEEERKKLEEEQKKAQEEAGENENVQKQN